MRTGGGSFASSCPKASEIAHSSHAASGVAIRFFDAPRFGEICAWLGFTSAALGSPSPMSNSTRSDVWAHLKSLDTPGLRFHPTSQKQTDQQPASAQKEA